MEENNHTQIKKDTTKKSFFREVIEILIFVIPTVFIIQTFIGRTFIVVGNSMKPTFENGDYLIIDRLSYKTLRDPSRFEVIVFHPPYDKKVYYIKRVIGLPGETVTVNGNDVEISGPNGDNKFKLDEPYRSSNGEKNATVELGEDEYFVMGDNREVSSDSREWGKLSKSSISGRAFIRLFPITSIDLWPGSFEKTK